MKRMSCLESGADAVAPKMVCIDERLVPWIDGAGEAY
jgi:hypothetical protein